MIFLFIFGNNLFMIKSKLAICIDSISITILIFITLIFWLNKYIKNAFYLYFLCIIISLCLFFIIFKYYIKQYNLKNITNKELKHLKCCVNFFKLSEKDKVSDFFKKLFYAKNTAYDFYETDKYIYYINIRKPLNCEDFYKALDYHHMNNKNLIFISEKYDNEFKDLIESSNKNFSIFDTQELYKLMKLKNEFPIPLEETKTFKQKSKIKILTFISTLTKHHFKDYLFSGLSLLAFSFFIPFSIYYAIFGTLLITLSIICLFNSKSNSSKQINNLSSLSETIKK